MDTISEQPDVIPRKVLFGNPERSSPRLSPDGTRIAYLAPVEGVLNVWVRTIGGDDDRAVTDDRNRGIRSYFWQTDSAHVIYQQDQGGDENFHLYQTNLESRLTHDLTPFEGARAMTVAVDRNYPDEILVGINHRDPRCFDVYRLNLKSRELTLDTENPGDVAGWTADNRLQVRVAQTQTPDGGAEIRIRRSATDAWTALTSWGPDESNGGVVGFTPDNETLLLVSSVDANAARLLDIDDGGALLGVVAEDPQYDVGSLMVNPRDHHLEAVSFTRARTEWIVIDPALQSDFDAVRLIAGGDFSIVSRDFEDRNWIVAFYGDTGSTRWYLYRRDSQASSFLFAAQPALDSYVLAPMQPVSFPARDGLTLHGYLTLPPGLPPKQLPLVLHVHGGPWSRDTWGFAPTVQQLANRGYAVLQVNYRGSSGYGKAHLNAGDREWGGKMHLDLLDGVGWVVDQGWVNPARVAIMGASYGGYAALVGLTFTPDAFACGIDIVGPSNLNTLLRTIPPYWEPMKARFFKRVGHPDHDVAFLNARSPLFFAGRIRAPLLIGQGANDPRVNKAESDQIVAAVRANGKPVDYLVFPDEGHGFARPENRLIFSAAAELFLAKYLGGRAEPLAGDERADAFRQ